MWITSHDAPSRVPAVVPLPGFWNFRSKNSGRTAEEQRAPPLLLPHLEACIELGMDGIPVVAETGSQFETRLW
jgi:hypothetical protein